MKSVMIIPVLMTVLAAGVWLVAPDLGRREPAESRPAKIGRNSDPGRHPAEGEEEPNKSTAASPALVKDRSLVETVIEMATSDPVQALKRAEAIADPKLRGETMGFAAAQWAALDADAVFAWLEARHDEEARPFIERMVFPALAEEDPVRVAAWLSEGKAQPQVMEAAVAATVQRWTQRNPATAAEWVGSFADERLLKAAVEPLISLWVKQEREAPAKWIEGLPAGITKEEACAAYAAALALSAPEEAKAWAAKIETKDLAEATRKRIAAAE
ncbi:hypothetical protein [Haloferula sp. BvORR071]|uniref:hypothetical protein n=1 Tax=Haloferula sp. BvORR071 TaxID=1396141 RepID=UPI0022410238|nr:hypothetical protein [Haloferula sp. BvORR071]